MISGLLVLALNKDNGNALTSTVYFLHKTFSTMSLKENLV
jgi:hypothetical protein